MELNKCLIREIVDLIECKYIYMWLIELVKESNANRLGRLLLVVKIAKDSCLEV